MAKNYQELQDEHKHFISAQKIFFVGTAAATGSVNISPKGMNTFKVISSKRVLWLNVTGSGNESAAHIHENPRMTLMFVSFTGAPLILRVYGNAKVIYQADPEWDARLHILRLLLMSGRYLISAFIWCKPPAACLCR